MLTDLVNVLEEVLSAVLMQTQPVQAVANCEAPAASPQATIHTAVMEEGDATTPEPTIMKSAPPPKADRVVVQTQQCRNREHPETGTQCTNQVRVGKRFGLCDDCIHPCKGGCGRQIPTWYPLCQGCKSFAPTTKLCKGNGCGAELPVEGPNYCSDCGHRCSGQGCQAVIPVSFKFCMADGCQDEKWLEENQPKQSSTGTSAGAKAHAAYKAARAKVHRAAARGGRGKKGG